MYSIIIDDVKLKDVDEITNIKIDRRKNIIFYYENKKSLYI